jgi:3-oxoacyl-[acyl-carrier protein] reductase
VTLDTPTAPLIGVTHVHRQRWSELLARCLDFAPQGQVATRCADEFSRGALSKPDALMHLKPAVHGVKLERIISGGGIMDFGLRGKVAAVAGSSKGVGKAVAMGLAAEGMKVCVNGRDAAVVNETAAEIVAKTGAGVLALPLDVATRAGADALVERTVATFGGLDVLVTNAGGPRAGGFRDLDDADFEAAFQLNFMSAVRLIRAAVPHLTARGQGRIINLQSTAIKQPVPLVTLTNSIRPGVTGLSKDLADELGPHNVTVNTILIGPTLTERLSYLLKSRAEARGVPEELVWKEFLDLIPMRRWGKPEEVASLAVYLASEQAGWMTGTAIQVDGGRTRSVL